MADQRPTKLDLDWTPKSVPVAYSVGGNTYPPTKQVDNVTRASDSRYAALTTPINTALTFSSIVTLPPGLFILEYKWDFGDGAGGYGSSISHTYSAANPATQVSLNVLTSDGKRYTVAKALNLRPADRIVVSEVVMGKPGTDTALMTSTTLTTTTTRATSA